MLFKRDHINIYVSVKLYKYSFVMKNISAFRQDKGVADAVFSIDRVMAGKNMASTLNKMFLLVQLSGKMLFFSFLVISYLSLTLFVL